MADEIIYHEKLSSNRTEALFLGLTLLFLLLFAWRVAAAGLGFLACVLLFFFLMFLFYSLNYRTLTIRLTPDTLKLAFGLFTWRVPLDNVRDCRLDKLPSLKRLGGAGIHFMTVDGRYRASFNFLEYPRVVLALNTKRGPVQDISFSTRRPEEILRLIRQAQENRP